MAGFIFGIETSEVRAHGVTVAHLVCNEGVRSSNLLGSTILDLRFKIYDLRIFYS